MRVLEVDQWTSTGKIEGKQPSEFNLVDVEGGDTKAARVIFGGWAVWRDVKATDTPGIGNVWFRVDGGRLRLWKTNYDSSD